MEYLCHKIPNWKVIKDGADWHLVWDYGSMRIAPSKWHYNIAVDAACDFMLRFQRNEWYGGCETVGDLMRVCADRAKKHGLPNIRHNYLP